MSRKYPKQFKLTVPSEAEGSFEKFVEIAEREGKSASEIVRNFVVDYVEKHAPGNPQQRIDTIAKIGHAYRAESCCVCAKPPVVQAFTKEGLSLLYCEECYEKTGRRKAIAHREYKKKKKRD